MSRQIIAIDIDIKPASPPRARRAVAFAVRHGLPVTVGAWLLRRMGVWK